jgi:hypothetical protein
MNKITLNQDGVTIESIKKIHLKTDGALYASDQSHIDG